MTSHALRRPVRRTVTALVLTLAAIGGTALAAAPAHAELSYVEDTFDDNPASRWSVSSTGSGVGGFANGRASMMHAIRTGAGWTAITRNVRVPAVGWHDCFAGIYLRTMSVATVAVNVEVIRPGDFSYVAMETVQVSGQAWKGYSVSWSDGPLDVLFRVSMLGAESTRSIEVDDMMFVCDHQYT